MAEETQTPTPPPTVEFLIARPSEDTPPDARVKRALIVAAAGTHHPLVEIFAEATQEEMEILSVALTKLTNPRFRLIGGWNNG